MNSCEKVEFRAYRYLPRGDRMLSVTGKFLSSAVGYGTHMGHSKQAFPPGNHIYIYIYICSYSPATPTIPEVSILFLFPLSQ